MCSEQKGSEVCQNHADQFKHFDMWAVKRSGLSPFFLAHRVNIYSKRRNEQEVLSNGNVEETHVCVAFTMKRSRQVSAVADATHYITSNVLQTKVEVDAQSDK